MVPEWKQFEIAVTKFLAALDPSAKVTHDAKIPDVHTGELRQRDVWIETSFAGHFQIKILVSCKREKAPLDQQDIDAFLGELASSGANKGVIYSFSGFTKHALAKADKTNISCCVLYDGSTPQLPNAIAFTAFHVFEDTKITVTPDLATPFSSIRMSEIAEQKINDGGKLSPAVDVLEKLWIADEPELVANLARCPPMGRRVSVSVSLSDGRMATLTVESQWLVHRAKPQAGLLNGSYSLTDSNVKGSFSLPGLDFHSSRPGPEWEKIAAEELVITSPAMGVFYSLCKDFAKSWRKYIAENPDFTIAANNGAGPHSE